MGICNWLSLTRLVYSTLKLFDVELRVFTKLEFGGQKVLPLKESSTDVYTKNGQRISQEGRDGRTLNETQGLAYIRPEDLILSYLMRPFNVAVHPEKVLRFCVVPRTSKHFSDRK